MDESRSKDILAPDAEYSVGHLRNPRPEDKRFALRNDAVDAAFDGAKDEEVWAVWLGDNITMVVYDGESFT